LGGGAIPGRENTGGRWFPSVFLMLKNFGLFCQKVTSAAQTPRGEFIRSTL
jgi:hypothetical protein